MNKYVQYIIVYSAAILSTSAGSMQNEQVKQKCVVEGTSSIVLILFFLLL